MSGIINRKKETLTMPTIGTEELTAILASHNDFTESISSCDEFKEVARDHPEYFDQLFNKFVQHLDFYLQVFAKVMSLLKELELNEERKKEVFDHIKNHPNMLDHILDEFFGLARLTYLCPPKFMHPDDKQYLFEWAKNKSVSFEDLNNLKALVQLCPNEEEKEQIFQQGVDHLQEVDKVFKILRFKDLAEVFTNIKYQSQLLEYLANDFDNVVKYNFQIQFLRGFFHDYSDLFKLDDAEKTRANLKDWLNQRQYEASNMPTILAAISSANRSLPKEVAQRINEFVVIPNYLPSTSQFTKQFNSHNEISDIIQQEACNYLAQFANPQTSAGYQTSVRFWEQFEQQGIKAIWPSIEDQVKQRLSHETDCNDEAQDEDNLSYTITRILDHTPFKIDPKKSLSQSKGYQAFCSQLISANAWLTSSHLGVLENERQNAHNMKP